MIAARTGRRSGLEHGPEHRDGRRHRRGADGHRHRAGLRPGGHRASSSTTSPRSGSTRPWRRSTASARARSRRGQLDEADAQRDPRPHPPSPRRSTSSPTATSSIEAASENEEVKRKIFTSLRPLPEAGRDLASNTSSISITRLASVDREPRALHRHSLHEPGAADAARRAHPRHRHRGRHLRGGARRSSPGSARPRRCRRISRPSSSTASCCR